jgi:hypothetical protein
VTGAQERELERLRKKYPTLQLHNAASASRSGKGLKVSYIKRSQIDGMSAQVRLTILPDGRVER